MYSSEIGKWSTIDPSIDRYESISPYTYAFNNPIRFIDIKGSDPGDVVVGFTGGIVFESVSGGTPMIYEMVQSVSEQQKTQGGGSSLTVPTQLFPTTYEGIGMDGNPVFYQTNNYPPTKAALDRGTDEAFEFIKTHYNKDAEGNSVEGGRVTLLGFSYGGVMAMHLARRLEKAGIKVSVMGILDAAAGPESKNVDPTVSDNVVMIRNYYQIDGKRRAQNKVGSFGGPVRRKDGSTRSIKNIKVTVNHEEMDSEYGQALLNWVLQSLQHQKK